jgi:hypothetical protein
MVTGRALTALAALAVLVAVVLCVVPPTVNISDDGGRVSCGTLLFTTEYSFSDACQDARVPRIMATLAVWTAGLVLGTTGLVVLYRAVRHL